MKIIIPNCCSCCSVTKSCCNPMYCSTPGFPVLHYLPELLKPMSIQFSSVQSLSRVWPFATPWTAANQASLSITNSQSLFKLMSIESVMPSNHLILCCPLFLPSIFPASSSFLMTALSSRWPNSGASASTSVLPMNIQNWFPLGLAGLISLLSKGLSRVFSNTPVQKHQFFGAQLSLYSNSQIHTQLLEKL